MRAAYTDVDHSLRARAVTLSIPFSLFDFNRKQRKIILLADGSTKNNLKSKHVCTPRFLLIEIAHFY